MPHSDEHSEFCSRIKARRKDLGLTQLQVANSLGVTQPTYAELEAGRKEPRLGTLYKVAIALEVDVHDLLPQIKALQKIG